MAVRCSALVSIPERIFAWTHMQDKTILSKQLPKDIGFSRSWRKRLSAIMKPDTMADAHVKSLKKKKKDRKVSKLGEPIMRGTAYVATDVVVEVAKRRDIILFK